MLELKIFVGPGEDPSTVLDTALRALGYTRPSPGLPLVGGTTDSAEAAKTPVTPAPAPAPAVETPATEAPKGRGGRKPKAPTETADTSGNDTPQAQAQDAADEAKPVETPLTIDDLRKAMVAYSQKYGTPAMQEDGQKIFAEGLGNPPEGEPGWKMSLCNTPERLGKAVEVWKVATDVNPFGRTPIAATDITA